MNHWQYLPFAVLLVLMLAFSIRSAQRKRREQDQREFDRTLETLLLPRESVKLICPQKKGRCILTSRRLLFETRKGFTAVPLNTIKKVRGVTLAGKTTALVEKMAAMKVKAAKEHTIYPGENFPELYKSLKKKTEQKNSKDTKKKTREKSV